MTRANLRRNRPRPAEKLSDTAAWRLLDMAYADPASLWAYLAGCVILGTIAVACMRDLPSSVWAGSGVGLALAGLVDWHGYKARRAAGRLRFAQRRFMVMACLHGVFWGSANLVLLLSHDPLLQFWIINAETGILSLTVARLNPMGAAIKTQVVITTAPLVLCCLLTGNLYFEGYAILSLVYLFAVLAVVDELHGKTLRLLVTEEENTALIGRAAETNAQLQAANRRLEAMATTDGLTGIANRRHFDDTMRKEWDRAARAGTTLSLLLIDIDQFKSYNDTLGHPAGDACLRQVASTLARAIRGPSDLAARYGGEEFGVIIGGADCFVTIDIAERLRAAVEAMALPGAAGAPVTVSIGAAVCRPQDDPDGATMEAAQGIALLIAEADAHLYAAKRAGRNCVRTKDDHREGGQDGAGEAAGQPLAIPGR